jgi:hypothetical protein
MFLHALLLGHLYILYVDYFHTSPETYPFAITAYYGENVTFLCVDDVRASQETHLWASTACYGCSITLPFLLQHANVPALNPVNFLPFGEYDELNCSVARCT